MLLDPNPVDFDRIISAPTTVPLYVCKSDSNWSPSMSCSLVQQLQQSSSSVLAEGEIDTMHVKTSNTGIFGAVKIAVLHLLLDISSGFNWKYRLDAVAVCRASRDMSDGQGP